MGVAVSYLMHSLNKFPAYNPKMVELTVEEIDIIKKSWSIPKGDLVGAGETVLMKFFEKFPQNQNKFQAFKNTPLLSLKGTPGFRSHASRVMNVFDESVTALGTANDSEQIANLWDAVGKSHAKRKISRESFNELKQVVLEILTDVCKLDEQQQKTWDKLVDNVYSIAFMNMENK